MKFSAEHVLIEGQYSLSVRVSMVAVMGLSIGCSASESPSTTPARQREGNLSQTGTAMDGMAKNEEQKSMDILITSPAFSAGERIPKKYTGDGDDVSPPLHWSDVPDGAKELALICDDPDAPTDEPWVHWVLYKLSPNVTSLPEGVVKALRVNEPAGALQGKNSWPSGQTIGYRGPAPPPGHGTHHYHFRLYALDAKLDLEPGISKSELMKTMKGHILAQGELIGTYER